MTLSTQTQKVSEPMSGLDPLGWLPSGLPFRALQVLKRQAARGYVQPSLLVHKLVHVTHVTHTCDKALSLYQVL